MRGVRFRVQFYSDMSRRYENTGHGSDTFERALDIQSWRKSCYPWNEYRVAVRVPAGRRVINANNS